MILKAKIKESLDKACRRENKGCGTYDSKYRLVATAACWLCNKNDDLADELAQMLEEKA